MTVTTEVSGGGSSPLRVDLLLSGKRIAIAGLDTYQAERLSSVLSEAQATPIVCDTRDTGEAAKENCDISECHAAVLGIRTEESDEWSQPFFSGKHVLILAGEDKGILALAPSTRSRASDFLIDPWRPSEAILRLAVACLREGSAVSETKVASSRLRTVLIADDVVTVRLIVRAALEQVGIKCWVAESGSEALHMIRNHRPQVAVLDVNMPGKDGYSVLEEVRREDLPVRVVLLTGRRDPADVGRAVALGADDYIVKPFKPADLISRLESLISH